MRTNNPLIDDPPHDRDWLPHSEGDDIEPDPLFRPAALFYEHYGMI